MGPAEPFDLILHKYLHAAVADITDSEIAEILARADASLNRWLPGRGQRQPPV